MNKILAIWTRIRMNLLMIIISRAKSAILRILKFKTVGSRALIIRDDQILLIRHTYREGWYTVGGGVEKGETFKAAILRELKEEVGVTEVKDIKLFNIYHNEYEKRDDYVALYIVKNFEIQPSNSAEISEVKWFPLQNLPEDISPATLLRIKEYLGEKNANEHWQA